MATAGDDVAFGLENRAVPASEIWPRVDATLHLVGFRYGRERATAALSGGEQQRLALAGVLAHRPGLLLLDEPTANLDPAGAALVRGAIQRAGRATGTTTVLVEHRVDQAVGLVDRVVVLQPGGGLLADGTPGAVFGAHGAALAAAGVWVPGRPPRVPGAAAGHGPDLLRAEAAGVAGRLAAASLTVRGGEVLAVTGPNGAGKSTLALLLSGLAPPDAGRVRATPQLAGAAAALPPHRWRARDLVRRVGTVFQDPEHQLTTRRVADELALGPRLTGRPVAEVARRVDELLARLGLTALAEANPYTLSGGEKRRLSVATALATDPPLLVLDEPTFGQDRVTWENLVALLAQRRAAGGGAVVVTHDELLVGGLADRTLALEPVA
jgi:energy-coupling factor transport system ATP-binding protein